MSDTLGRTRVSDGTQMVNDDMLVASTRIVVLVVVFHLQFFACVCDPVVAADVDVAVLDVVIDDGNLIVVAVGVVVVVVNAVVTVAVVVFVAVAIAVVVFVVVVSCSCCCSFLLMLLWSLMWMAAFATSRSALPELSAQPPPPLRKFLCTSSCMASKIWCMVTSRSRFHSNTPLRARLARPPRRNSTEAHRVHMPARRRSAGRPRMLARSRLRTVSATTRRTPCRRITHAAAR